MAFRVGQKVVCVDDDPKNHGNWTAPTDLETLHGLTRGHVYTVQKIGSYRGAACVWIAEIQRPTPDTCKQFGEAGFSSRRFRPVVEKSTDSGMAILREILDRETIKDRAPIRAQ